MSSLNTVGYLRDPLSIEQGAAVGSFQHQKSMGKRWNFQTPREKLAVNLFCFLFPEESLFPHTIECKGGSCGSMFGDQYEELSVPDDCGGIDWEYTRKASGLRTRCIY